MDDYDAILRHLSPAMLVIVRIGGLMLFGPVFGSPMVPARVKVLLAFVLGLAVYPLLSAESLRGAGVEVDRKVLADLAISHPKAFSELAELAKSQAA